MTRAALLVAAAVVCCALSGRTALAVAPHAADRNDTDTCAMCHRGHGSASDATWDHSFNPWIRRSALLVGMSTGIGDTGLCYTCHGVESLGSETDVQSSFEETSGHRLGSEVSTYGPSPKQCSTCHDSHGGAKVSATTPYPSLLRSYSPTNNPVYAGVEFCATCHADRPADTWDGIETWRRTMHASEIATPMSGTGVVCSACHDPHGTRFAPSIVTTLTPPADPTTSTVSANDRSLCLGCHGAQWGIWSGTTTYTASSHGSTIETVAMVGEWPLRDLRSDERFRDVGECQNCHAPMGSAETSLATVPDMLEKSGRALCDDCHDSNGPSASDIATMTYAPSAVDTEVVAVWRPSVETSTFGRVAMYTPDVTETVPFALSGPREASPTGRTGEVAVGDIDANGIPDLLVADDAAARIDVYAQDPLRGFSKWTGVGTLSIPAGAPAHLLEVADVVVEGTGRPEIAVVTRSDITPHPSRLYLYRYVTGSGLTLVNTGGTPVGNDASSIASGDCTSTAAADLVITAAGDDRFSVFRQSGSTVTSSGPLVTGSAPRGVSVGDASVGGTKKEIVLVATGAVTNNVRVYNGDGSGVGSYTATGNAGATYAYDSVIADVWPGTTPAGSSGQEVLIALRSNPTTFTALATSSLNVFPQATTGGLSPGGAQRIDTGNGFETSALDAGEVDGDTRVEAVVANAGRWMRDGTAVPPSIQVYRANPAGTALSSAPATYFAMGVELASGIPSRTGEPPAIVVADVGDIGPSRHDVSTVSGAHTSTETAPVSRHVECSDCHNTHAAKATTAAAPGVYGALFGSRGVAVRNNASGAAITYTYRSAAAYEYQTCFRCHSAYSTLPAGSTNVASEVNTRNASVHAVEGGSLTASATAGSFTSATPAWSKTSVLHCRDCHGNSDVRQASGPHASDAAPLLRGAFRGVRVSSQTMFCYRCHKYSVYYSGTEDTATLSSNSFFNYAASATSKLHNLHAQQWGYSCRACHIQHGSASRLHLQNGDHAYEHDVNGGACTTPCHRGTARRAYSRVPAATPPTSIATLVGTLNSGDLAAVSARGGTAYDVNEANGAPGISIEATFTSLTQQPLNLNLYAWFANSPGVQTLNVQVWNFSTLTWDTLGTLPETNAYSLQSYAFTSVNQYSSGMVRVRVHRAAGGLATRNLKLDHVYVTF